MSTPEQQSKEKFEKLKEFLEGEYCLIHLDSGIEGVTLPSHLLKRYQVTLQVSRFFRGGLELTPEQISTDLVFDGSYFTCVVPLSAIWGTTSAGGENVLWPDSAPREVLAKILNESIRLEKGDTKTPEPQVALAPAPKPTLTAVQPTVTLKAAKSPKTRARKSSTKKKTPKLKLVK